MTADYRAQGDIAVITLSNPPVNGLGLSTRQGIAQGLAQASADAAIAAIVITGAGKAFSAAPTSKSSAAPVPCKSPTWAV